MRNKTGTNVSGNRVFRAEKSPDESFPLRKVQDPVWVKVPSQPISERVAHLCCRAVVQQCPEWKVQKDHADHPLPRLLQLPHRLHRRRLDRPNLQQDQGVSNRGRIRPKQDRLYQKREEDVRHLQLAELSPPLLQVWRDLPHRGWRRRVGDNESLQACEFLLSEVWRILGCLHSILFLKIYLWVVKSSYSNLLRFS